MSASGVASHVHRLLSLLVIPLVACALPVSADMLAAPGNDACGNAVPLFLDQPVNGTTVDAANDYELSGDACFTGIGQTATSSPGRDVAYKFKAPSAGSYSFKVSNYGAADPALYVTNACPTGAAPIAVGTPPCLAAANRASGTVDEVMCLAIASGATVYAFVDEVAAAGGTFQIEVIRCVREYGGDNDSPPKANALACGIEGSISGAGDVDFFALSTLDSVGTNHRIFAFADTGAAAGATSGADLDMRITTGVDTLEFDDDAGSAPFGGNAPAIAGTKATGVAAYVRLAHHNGTETAEPYRLYAVVQPPSGSAKAESEPNDTPAQANKDPLAYFSGDVQNADEDLYEFVAAPGDLIFLAVDGDPAYSGTGVDLDLALLDSAGNVIVLVDGSGGTSSNRAPVTGDLTGTSPVAPAEALVFRALEANKYYARVRRAAGTGGAYLLSISKNCANGGFLPDVADYYQHQRFGKTAAGGENHDDWEKTGGWCAFASLEDLLYYWKQRGYEGLLPDGVRAQDTWLDKAYTELAAISGRSFRDKFEIKTKNHGDDKPAGRGGGLEVLELSSGNQVEYTSAMPGNPKLKAGGNLMDVYRLAIDSGTPVHIKVLREGAGDPVNDVWWTNYHMVAGVGYAINGDGTTTVYFNDPDTNKGNSDAKSAGGCWRSAKRNATDAEYVHVNALKHIPWDGTKDVIPLPSFANPDTYFAAKITADGKKIDGGVAANARYRNVRLDTLEIIAPIGIAKKIPFGPSLLDEALEVTSPTLTRSVDAFWFYPVAGVDPALTPTFDLHDGSAWTATFLAPGTPDPLGNVRSVAGVKIELASGGPIDPAEIGDFTVRTVSTLGDFDALFRDAASPGSYHIQAHGAPGTEHGEQTTCAGPAGSPLLGWTNKTTLVWPALAGALSYDSVSGDLSTLRSTHSFTTSVTQCLGNDVAATALAYGTTPAAGQGTWFLVRGVGCGCAAGSYDTGALRQVASRDASIDASLVACP